MIRRFLAVLLTVVAILAAGWLALRRPDIPHDALEAAYSVQGSQFLTLNSGAKVHVVDEGPDGAPTLLMIHGFSASLHTWEAWASLLSDEYRVVRIDLPGHGLTRGVPLENITMDGFVALVDELADTMALEDMVVIGSSMGGHVAWRYALEHPGDVDGLVLVAAAGWPEMEGDNPPLIFSLMENAMVRKLIRDLDMSSMIRSGLKDSVADPALVTDAMVERYTALSRAPGNRDALLQLMARSDDRALATPEMMARIGAPTLVMHGEKDGLIPVSAGRRFAETIPDADLVVYDDLGHLPQEEAPARSVADLRAFLETRLGAPDELPHEEAALGPGSSQNP